MGLLSAVLLFPISGPVRGLDFVLERLQDEVEYAMLDEGSVQAELYELSLRRDLGEMSNEEYEERETELFVRLNAIRSFGETPLVTEATSEDDE